MNDDDLLAFSTFSPSASSASQQPQQQQTMGQGGGMYVGGGGGRHAVVGTISDAGGGVMDPMTFVDQILQVST